MAGNRSPSDSPEFETLLQELRVLLPGAQVTFSFLLFLPFTERFGSITTLQRNVYVLAYVSAAVAVVCLTAPGVYHRIRWRDVEANTLLRRSSRLTITATVFLAVSLSSITFVIADLLFDGAITWAITGTIILLLAATWYGRPLADRAQGKGKRSD